MPGEIHDVTSLTSLWNGALWITLSTVFWYFLISLSATVPGLNLLLFLTPASGTVFFFPVSFDLDDIFLVEALICYGNYFVLPMSENVMCV